MRAFFGLLLLVAAVSIVSSTEAEPLPPGFQEHKFNGPNAPSTKDGVTTFQIVDGGCSNLDYGDGRGESDCKRGNVRSTMFYDPQARVGQVGDYRFDLKIAQNFAYRGRFHAETVAFIPGGWDSHLRIASWEGPALHNFLYMVKVDGRNGVTFLGRQCQSPEQFGEWVSFSMKVRWSSDESGWIKVTCDDKIVYADERVATNQAPHCWEFTNQCKEGEFRNPDRFHYILGPVMLGNGSDFGSNLTPIQEGGITIQMRNVEVGTEAELYEPKDVAVIKQLQETLNALGCDVGTADGVAGPRTRAAALDCRHFEAGLPAALNVGTAAAFLAAYGADGVADLPRGGGTVEPQLLIRMGESGSENSGADPRAVTTIAGVVEGPGAPGKLSFMFIGEGYSPVSDTFSELQILFPEPLGKKLPGELTACSGHRIEDWGDDGLHVVLEFYGGRTYRAKNADCILKALPDLVRVQATYILDNFQAIASRMVADGSAETIQHDGIRSLIVRGATGEAGIAR